MSNPVMPRNTRLEQGIVLLSIGFAWGRYSVKPAVAVG